MERAEHYASLGLDRNATEAEVEAAYLALTQFLDPKKVPSPLRRWALSQLTLVDEAYAALIEPGIDEGETTAPAQTREGARSAAPAAPRQPSLAHREARRPEPEYDDDEEYEELADDDEPPRRSYSPAPSSRKVTSASGRASGSGQGQPRWQERGRSRPRQEAALPARRRPSRATSPSPTRQMVIGLAVGLAILLGAYFVAAQYRIGPFGTATVVEDQGSDKAIPINKARYDQLKAIVDKDPRSFPALFELGQMTFEAFLWEESIDWLEKALTVEPNDVLSIQDVGTANFNLGNREAAREMWLRALEIDPNNPQTHWNLGFYYASKQPADIDAAIAEWQKVIQFTSPNDQLYQLAETHLNQYKNRGSGTPAATPAAR